MTDTSKEKGLPSRVGEDFPSHTVECRRCDEEVSDRQGGSCTAGLPPRTKASAKIPRDDDQARTKDKEQEHGKRNPKGKEEEARHQEKMECELKKEGKEDESRWGWKIAPIELVETYEDLLEREETHKVDIIDDLECVLEWTTEGIDTISAEITARAIERFHEFMKVIDKNRQTMINKASRARWESSQETLRYKNQASTLVEAMGHIKEICDRESERTDKRMNEIIERITDIQKKCEDNKEQMKAMRKRDMDRGNKEEEVVKICEEIRKEIGKDKESIRKTELGRDIEERIICKIWEKMDKKMEEWFTRMEIKSKAKEKEREKRGEEEIDERMDRIMKEMVNTKRMPVDEGNTKGGEKTEVPAQKKEERGNTGFTPGIGRMRKTGREFEGGNGKAAVLTLRRSEDANLTYAEILTKARERISIEEIGIEAVRTTVTAKGERVLEIQGDDAERKARIFAGRLLEIFQQKEIEIKERKRIKGEMIVRGLDESATPEEVVEEVARKGGCAKEEVDCGIIKSVRYGPGSIWIRLPIQAMHRIMDGRKLQVGWSIVEVVPVKRKAQCFRCLEYGHLARNCNNKERRRTCYRCGEEEHLARLCTNPPRCVLCGEKGMDPTHRMGSRECSSKDGPLKEKEKEGEGINTAQTQEKRSSPKKVEREEKGKEDETRKGSGSRFECLRTEVDEGDEYNEQEENGKTKEGKTRNEKKKEGTNKAWKKEDSSKKRKEETRGEKTELTRGNEVEGFKFYRNVTESDDTEDLEVEEENTRGGRKR